MIEVVLETILHNCLKWLGSQYESIFVVTVQLDLVPLRNLVEGLHLIRLKSCTDIGLLFVTLVLTLHNFVFWRSDEWIQLIKVLFLEQELTTLENLILASRYVGYSWINHDLLLVAINVTEWVYRFSTTEILSDILINLPLFIFGRIYFISQFRLNSCSWICGRQHSPSKTSTRQLILVSMRN